MLYPASNAFRRDKPGISGTGRCCKAWGNKMNLYEVTLHGTESIYLLASTKYRALELVGDYFADAGQPSILKTSNLVVRQVDLSEEQILRPEKCRACPLNE
jgi:hypothetical protein